MKQWIFLSLVVVLASCSSTPSSPEKNTSEEGTKKKLLSLQEESKMASQILLKIEKEGGFSLFFNPLWDEKISCNLSFPTWKEGLQQLCTQGKWTLVELSEKEFLIGSSDRIYLKCWDAPAMAILEELSSQGEIQVEGKTEKKFTLEIQKTNPLQVFYLVAGFLGSSLQKKENTPFPRIILSASEKSSTAKSSTKPLLTQREQEIVLEELEQKYIQLRKLSEDVKVDPQKAKDFLETWDKAQKILKKKAILVDPTVEEKINKVSGQIQQLSSTLEVIKQNAYVQQGAWLLQKMQDSYKSEEFTRMLSFYYELQKLTASMIKRGEFKKAGEFLTQTKNYLSQLAVYYSAKKIPHKIQGLLIREGKKAEKKICINGYWVSEGDFVMDEKGYKTKLQVSSISDEKIKFQYKSFYFIEILE